MSSASQLKTDLTIDFEQATNSKIKKSVKASKLTTFRIGGDFEFFIEPNSLVELCQIVKWAKSNSEKINILGSGSNLLANSDGVAGWTLHPGRSFKFFENLADNRFRVGAAYSLTSLARELSLAGYSGLEFAAGIPASLGGAVRMNAGAHKSEMASVLTAIEGVDASGEEVKLEASQINFSYRHCSLPKEFIVTAVEIKLEMGNPANIMQNLNDNLNYRKSTQPLTLPSAGSVFRNPGNNPEQNAGYIIEKLGLKGYKNGGAEISSLHGNWIVNPNKRAQSSEVAALIELCKSQAASKFSLDLQTELVMW